MGPAPGIRSQELTTGLFYQNLTAIVVMTAWTTFIVYYVIWELSAPEGHKKALLADYMIMYDFMGVYYPTMKYRLDIGGLSQFMGNQILNIWSRWLLSWTSSDFGRMIIFMIPSLTFRWCLIDCIDKILPAMSWNPGHRSKQTQLVYNFQMILWKTSSSSSLYFDVGSWPAIVYSAFSSSINVQQANLKLTVTEAVFWSENKGVRARRGLKSPKWVLVQFLGPGDHVGDCGRQCHIQQTDSVIGFGIRACPMIFSLVIWVKPEHDLTWFSWKCSG